MNFFSSNFDFENFIAIVIPIENCFRIDRILIEKSAMSKPSGFPTPPNPARHQSYENDLYRYGLNCVLYEHFMQRERGMTPVRDRKTLFVSNPI